MDFARWKQLGPIWISAACAAAGILWFSRPAPDVRMEDLAELRAAAEERAIAYLSGDETPTNAWTVAVATNVTQTGTDLIYRYSGAGHTNDPPHDKRVDHWEWHSAAYDDTFDKARDFFTQRNGGVYWIEKMVENADGNLWMQHNDHRWQLSGTNALYGTLEYDLEPCARLDFLRATADGTNWNVLADAVFFALGAGTNVYNYALPPPVPSEWGRLVVPGTVDRLPCELASPNQMLNGGSWAISTNDLNAARAALTNMTRACYIGGVDGVHVIGTTNAYFCTLGGSATNAANSVDDALADAVNALAVSYEEQARWINPIASWSVGGASVINISQPVQYRSWASASLTKSRQAFRLRWPCDWAYRGGLVSRIRVYALLSYYNNASLPGLATNETWRIEGNNPSAVYDQSGLGMAVMAVPYFPSGTQRATFGNLWLCNDPVAAKVLDVASPSEAPGFTIDTFGWSPGAGDRLWRRNDDTCDEAVDASAAVYFDCFIIVADFNFTRLSN